MNLVIKKNIYIVNNKPLLSRVVLAWESMPGHSPKTVSAHTRTDAGDPKQESHLAFFYPAASRYR